ncbi:hypothetical protein TRVA0_030S01838 [Trichomonascus vanleenenianus]|uniref:uncharacterized protein n=1 Tax=Trichomonascus vanleenenianus TaxID=2268995 RepID=UPI003ECA718C
MSGHKYLGWFTPSDIEEHEKECILPKFDANVAWELGSLIRQRAQSYDKAVAISIMLTGGQVYFHALSKPGTNVDNQKWIERKQRTVLRFNTSSLYMGCKMWQLNRTIQDFAVTEQEYAFHGGGFPIRVQNVDSLIGVIVVSGLRQDEDHLIIVDSIKEYLSKL